MGSSNHDIIVKVGFTADQYVWMKEAAEESGLSHSAYIRNLVAEERRRRALASLSVMERYGAMDDSGPFRAHDLSAYK